MSEYDDPKDLTNKALLSDLLVFHEIVCRGRGTEETEDYFHELLQEAKDRMHHSPVHIATLPGWYKEEEPGETSFPPACGHAGSQNGGL